MESIVTSDLQWNSDFSNPRFFEPHDFSNHGMFPLDLLKSNTLMLSPIFLNPRFSKLPIYWANSCLSWKKFIKKCTFDFSNPYEIFKVLLSSLYLKDHTSQRHNAVNSIKESIAQCLSSECPLIRPGFPVGTVYYMYMYMVVPTLSLEWNPNVWPSKWELKT